MYIGISSIPSLEGLTSLSVCHCGVGRDSDAVLELTNLEYLGLTGVTVPACSEEEEWQPWSKFEAWPALHVFKFAGCWLIDDSTALDIASVQEVHTDRLAVGVMNVRVHLYVRERHAATLKALASSVSVWSTTL